MTRLTATELSLRTLKRAGLQLVVCLLAAAAQASAGQSFARSLAALAILISVVCACLAALLGERANAPYWTRLDEAVWFFMLAYAALHWPG